MADNRSRMRQSSRAGLMDRLNRQVGQGQKKQATYTPDESEAMVAKAAQGAPQDAPPPRSSGGFDADAFARQMNNVGTAQGTREAQAAQTPADPDPENEADLPNFAENSRGAQRRRLGLRDRMARR